MDGRTPKGASKAALEMATEVWAKKLAGTDVPADFRMHTQDLPAWPT